MWSTIKRSLLDAMPARLAGVLRGSHIRLKLSRFPQRLVEHDYGGRKFTVSITDPLAEAWYDHDWAELPEILELGAGRLRSGARVYDIGAHQGIVAMMLASAVGDAGQVVALEANGHNASIAQRNCDQNRIQNLKVVCAAISNRPGKLAFNQSLNGQIDDGTGSWGRTEVEAFTIDGLAERFGPPDVVFLDVEGAEGMALEGASKVLAAGADFFVEVHVGCGLEKLGSSVDRILSYFPQDRYSVRAKAEDEPAFRPLAAADPITRDRFYLIASAK